MSKFTAICILVVGIACLALLAFYFFTQYEIVRKDIVYDLGYVLMDITEKRAGVPYWLQERFLLDR